MEADAAQGRPLRAALVVGRLNGDQPAAGFFLKAAELGVFAGHDHARGFRAKLQREGLWALTD